MTHIDSQIARLETELAALRRRKLEMLQAQVAELTGVLGGIPRTSAASKRGKRRKWQRISAEDAIGALRDAVSAAGRDGIAGKQASEASGVSYPRAIKLLDANFKKSGSGKWTRYTLK